jgi:DNA-binding transcriptional LysR family regulator
VLDIDDRRVDVSSEGYDAVIRNGPIVDSRLVAWKLSRSRRMLVASPDYLARHGVPKTLADLDRSQGHLLHQSRRFRLALPDAGWGHRRARQLGVGMNNGDMIRDAAVLVSASRCCPPSSPARPSAKGCLSRSMSATSRRPSSSIWPIRRAAIHPPSCAPSPITSARPSAIRPIGTPPG